MIGGFRSSVLLGAVSVLLSVFTVNAAVSSQLGMPRDPDGVVTNPAGGSTLNIGSTFDVEWSFPPSFSPTYATSTSSPDLVPYYSWKVLFAKYRPDGSKSPPEEIYEVAAYNFTGSDNFQNTPRKINVKKLVVPTESYVVYVDYTCNFDQNAVLKKPGCENGSCRPCAGFFWQATAVASDVIKVASDPSYKTNFKNDLGLTRDPDGTVTKPAGGSNVSVGSSFDVEWTFPSDFKPTYADATSSPDRAPYYSWDVIFSVSGSKGAVSYTVGSYNFTGADNFGNTPRKIGVKNLQIPVESYVVHVDYKCNFDPNAATVKAGGRPCAGFFQQATAVATDLIKVISPNPAIVSTNGGTNGVTSGSASGSTSGTTSGSTNGSKTGSSTSNAFVDQQVNIISLTLLFGALAVVSLFF